MVEGTGAQIVQLRDGAWHPVARFPLGTAYPAFDRFPDGRWLIAAVRTDDAPNARILAPDGTLQSRLMLGDGIGELEIDGAGRIWVGWFDEGVFGNGTWRVPDHEWAPSSYGVGCFTLDGRWLGPPDLPGGHGMIADCYALTAGNNDAWILPYEDFPLVQLDPHGPTRWWRTELSGPDAVAVDGNHAIVSGGYGEDRAKLVLLAIDGPGRGEPARILATGRMPMRRAADGKREVWEAATLIAGRSGVLHLIDGGVWYSWRIADAVAALTAR